MRVKYLGTQRFLAYIMSTGEPLGRLPGVVTTIILSA